MPTEIISPKDDLIGQRPPSRICLDMAFGVGAGTELKDKSRYRSHGAIVGADWADGLHGRCLDFVRANNDYVEIPASHTQLNFTSQDFSIVARVIFDAFPDNAVIFDRGAFNVDGYRFVVLSTGAMRLYTSQLVTQNSGTGVGSVATGAWYTLGVSRAGANVRLYRNGVDITTIFGVHIDPLTCARRARIGSTSVAIDDLLDGKMEFLRIFGGIALAASEHLAWHRALV